MDRKQCPLYIPVPEGQIQHNAVIYTYPHGGVDVIAAKSAIFREPGYEERDPKPRKRGSAREAGKKSTGDDRMRSARRARSKVRRLALANEFEYFVTLTLDPEKVDRHDPAAIMKIANRWLDNMVRRKGLRYILVPELHKKGAFHFHGFFAGSGLEVADSGHTDAGGHPVFNLPQWPLGFTTAIRLYGEYPAAVGYVCKYIGKQDGERPMGRWYYSGGQLREPPKLYADLDFEELCAREDAYQFDTAIGKMAVIHKKMEV